MSSIIKVLSVAVAMLGLTAAAHADVISDSLYHLTLCSSSGPGSPCYVQPIQAPIPSLSGIDEAIAAFYDPIFPDSDWLYNVTGANNLGYVYGSLITFLSPSCGERCETEFVYYQPQQKILCCLADYPYRLIGLNDNGVFIGTDGSEDGFFASSEITPSQVIPHIPTLDAASIAFLESLGLDPFLFLGFFPYTAIDNANRIGGDFRSGSFVLTPVNEVPEPSSIVLFVSAFMLGAGILKIGRAS